MSCSKARSLPEVKYIGGRLLSGFGRKKSGVLISPKGKRERRCLRCRIQFSMCHYLGGGLHGRQKRVKAQSESSKSVVNSVLISREMPVFPGFLEIIRVVINEKYNQFLITVRKNFSYYYGEYISAVLRDIPAVIVPLERIARNPYLNQILLNLSTIDSKNDEQYIDLSKGNSLARYFFTVNYLLEKRILGEKSQCFLKEIGEFNDLIKGLKIIILLRNGKIELKDDVEKIKDFFETKGNVYQFLDKPHSNLFFDIILNQLSYPLHNNVLHNARYQYVAKSNLMFTDVSIYDECRYIYEWLPGLHQIISSFRDKSWQYVFRFALDGLVKMRQSYNNEFFFQGAIISNSIDEFSSKKLKERVQIK